MHVHAEGSETERPRPPDLSTATATRIPGEPGIWLFVAGDLIVFSAFFILIALGQREQSALFFQSRAQLDLGAGLFNTLLLLTGSWCVALGVQRCSSAVAGTGRRFFSLGILCGLGFVVNKGLEWKAKFAQGISPKTNEFFMYYFVFTGIHLLHVLVGIGVLCMLRSLSQNSVLNARQMRTLESGATFWHLVDLLWIVLFALLYLL